MNSIFLFLSLHWWLQESLLFFKCQWTASSLYLYITSLQIYNIHFSLYWSFKTHFYHFITYRHVFRLQAYLYIFLTFFADGWGCTILDLWSLENLIQSCLDQPLHIKLWYIDFIHVYLQKVLSDKGLHWFRKHLYTETTAWTNTSVMIYLYINSKMLSKIINRLHLTCMDQKYKELIKQSYVPNV